MMTTKPKVGFFDLTGCQGCLLSILFNEDELLDILNLIDAKVFRFAMSETTDEPLDIAFVEGTVVSKDDEEMIKKIRNKSKILIALGTCACEGCIPAMRNFIDEKELEPLKYKKKNLQQEDIGKPKPIGYFVKTDYSLPGCPPDREEIKRFIKEILLGKKYRNCSDPVCIECRLNNNGCLIDEGQICLGPITAGGCNAVCPTAGFRCYGCRGLNENAQIETYLDLMESKGIEPYQIKKMMETFMALSINEKLRDTKWEKLL